MNVIKLILIIVAVLGVLAVCVTPATAETITWNNEGPGSSWHEGDNWDLDRAPNGADDVVIPSGFPVRISQDDAECKTLSVALSSLLEVDGKTLLLGDGCGDTTSDIEGELRLTEDASDNAGILTLLRWVTFEGDGIICAPTAADRGVIQRNGGLADRGIIITEGIVLAGNINLLCDVDHQGGVDSFVGTNDTGQLMTFGRISGPTIREPDIKGTGTIAARLGTVRFTVVDFDDTTAPNWEIEDGTINLTDDAAATHYSAEVFDIDMIKGIGTLDLDKTLVSTGNFKVIPHNTIAQHTIELAVGMVFQIGTVSAP